MEHFKDLHFFQISSQGNLYTLSTMKLPDGGVKLVAASLRREVICFEYSSLDSNVLCGSTKEIMFTYMPSGAEIIAIDAFNRSSTEIDVVIGIAIIKQNHDSHGKEMYLNVYSKRDDISPLDLDSIGQNCCSIELGFIPYHLYHTDALLHGSENKEVVWLLSGSDERIHLYTYSCRDAVYRETELKDHFPELTNAPSIVMWINIKYLKDSPKRLSAYGCECGTISLSLVNGQTSEVLAHYSTHFENTISEVRIFSDFGEKRHSKKDEAPSFFNFPKQKQQHTTKKRFNLLVTNTVLPSVVFEDIENKGLTEYVILEGSDDHNVTSCCTIADIDFDGSKEILLGTYGQKLLTYKRAKGEWIYSGSKNFADPIYSLAYMDLTGDGVKELIVFTLRGVQILQHCPEYVQRKLDHKIRLLERIYEKVKN